MEIEKILKLNYKIGDKFALNTLLNIKPYDDSLDKNMDLLKEYENMHTDFFKQLLDFKFARSYSASYEERVEMIKLLTSKKENEDDEFGEKINNTLQLIVNSIVLIRQQV